MKLFQAPSTITSIKTTKDRCLELKVITQELPPEQMAEVMSLYELFGWFLFKESAIVEDDIKDLPEVKRDKTEKSPSQRHRNRFFVWYKWKKGNSDGFNTWYESFLDKQGQDKLNEMN